MGSLRTLRARDKHPSQIPWPSWLLPIYDPLQERGYSFDTDTRTVICIKTLIELAGEDSTESIQEGLYFENHHRSEEITAYHKLFLWSSNPKVAPDLLNLYRSQAWHTMHGCVYRDLQSLIDNLDEFIRLGRESVPDLLYIKNFHFKQEIIKFFKNPQFWKKGSISKWVV